MEPEQGLINAFLLDQQGGATSLTWNEIKKWTTDQGPLWIHLDRDNSTSQQWLKKQANLDSLIAEALLAEETRPRSIAHNNGLLIILRGVNMNPGADPEDMVSIRLWIESSRIITLRKRKLMAIQDIRDSLDQKNGPKDAADFLCHLTNRLIHRMGPVIDDIEDEISELEEEILTSPSHKVRFQLSNIRRKSIKLRRYLAPQRDVMTHLLMERPPWFSDTHRAHLREVNDRLLRYIEDLDETRDRAAVTQEELLGRISEQMNKTMYLLAIVATIFLPLGLLTGLLGINVGGIPGTDNSNAFLIVCLILGFIVLIETIIFRFRKWF